MPPGESRLWTMKRKIMGNVLPLVLSSPPLVMAVKSFATEGPSTATLLWTAAFPVSAWVMACLTALVGNGRIKREMGRRLHMERPFDLTEKYFVGFARPTYRSALDPHEDVGFLILHEDRIEFWGAERRVSLTKDEVAGVRFRPNTHTLVGLGRWISIEAVVDEKPVRLLIEPREKRTLLGNLLFSKRLLEKLREWKGEEPQAEAQGSNESSSEA